MLEVGNGRFHGFPYRQIVHVLLHHVPDEACGFGFLAQRLIARLTRLSLFQLSRQARFFCLCLVQLGFTIRQFRRQGRSEGYTPSWKKAIFTLSEDSKAIEFFEGKI